MTIPTTTLEELGSDPGAPYEVGGRSPVAGVGRAVLDRDRACRWAPHVAPIVAAWLDDALHFCSGETELKAAILGGASNRTQR